MRIIEKGILDLTPKELRQCRSLSLRDGGLMCEVLTNWRWRERQPDHRLRRKCRVIMIKYDDNDNLIAWAFVFPKLRRRGTRTYNAYFYTRVKERNKGYGTILMDKVREIYPKPYVCPHDWTSGYFFKKHRNNVRFDSYDSRWVA